LIVFGLIAFCPLQTDGQHGAAQNRAFSCSLAFSCRSVPDVPGRFGTCSREQRATAVKDEKGRPSQMVDRVSDGTVSLYREGKIIARSTVIVGLDGDAAARQNLAIGQVGKGAHDRIR
jgi:hypothetical protein